MTKLGLFIALFLLVPVVLAGSSENVLEMSFKFKATEREFIDISSPEVGLVNLTNFTDFEVSLNSLKMGLASQISPYIPDNKNGYPFVINIFSEENIIKSTNSFKINFFSSPYLLDEVSATVILPYASQDKYLSVQFGNETKLLLDLGELLCNRNNTCDSTENYYSCPEDCKLNQNDGICTFSNDGVCDPDCVYDEDCYTDTTSTNQPLSLLPILIVVISLFVLILLIIIFIITKKRKSSTTLKPKKNYQQLMKEMGFRK